MWYWSIVTVTTTQKEMIKSHKLTTISKFLCPIDCTYMYGPGTVAI